MTRLRFTSVLMTIVALVALATTFAACGDGDSEGGSAGDPQTVIDSATLEGVESGVLDLSLAVNAEGREGGDIDVSLSGPFQAAMSGADKPQFDLTASVDGSFNDEEVKFDGGLVLLPNSAYVNYEGTDYEVDPTTLGFVEATLEQAQRQGGGGEPADVTACQEAASKLEVGNFVDGLSDDGGADVGGTRTTKVSGDLDVSGAIDALVDLAEDPACSAQIGAAGELPSESEVEEAKSQLGEAVKTAHVDVYVGNDDIVRQVSAQVAIDPPKGSGEGPQSAEIEFELKLTEVNEEQEISAPDGAKPLNDLFLKLGVNPIELLELVQSEDGAGGIGGLLEGLGEAAGGSGSGSSDGGDQQAYLKCLGEARTPVDLQNCAKLRG